jgi:hypothetical protein
MGSMRSLSIGRDDAGDEVEGKDALDPLVFTIDGEGDAPGPSPSSR